MRDWNEYDRHHVRSNFRRADEQYFPGQTPLTDERIHRRSGMYERRNQSRHYRPDHHDHHRSWWNRAGDEILSWFGDDYAERRRRHDTPDDGMHRGKGPKSYRRSDDRIREDVNDKLTDEWNVDASDIEVAVVDGEVTLTGFVSDRYQKRRAEEVAEKVSGVRNVENRLKVDPYTDKANVNLMP